MIRRLRRATLLAMYQFTLLVGILLMPVALATQRVGFRLPLDRAVLGVKQRYERVHAAN